MLLYVFSLFCHCAVASDSLQSETAMLKAELHAARRDHRELEGKFALLSKVCSLTYMLQHITLMYMLRHIPSH